MDVERIEILGFDVSDLDEAIRKFSNILGTTFHVLDSEGRAMQSANSSYAQVRARAAIEKDAVRNIHVKVPDLDDAVLEMKLKGYTPIDVVRISNLKEAIFSPRDFSGIRLCFVEYGEPTLVGAMLATRQG